MKPEEKAIEYLMKNKDIYSFDDGTYKAIDIALKARDREWEKLIELARKNSFSNGFNKGVISGSKEERVEKVIDERIGKLDRNSCTEEAIIWELEELKQKMMELQ